MKLLKPFVAEPIGRSIRPIETEEEILAKKEQFAELLLRESEPFKVALVIYPDDTGQALRIAREWPSDAQVLAIQQSLKDSEGEITFLPTHADAARLAWNMARDENRFTDDRLKALKLYAEIRGFIQKPNVTVNQNNNHLVQNNVMVVRDHGTDDEWETKLRNQQRALKASVIEGEADVSSGTA